MWCRAWDLSEVQSSGQEGVTCSAVCGKEAPEALSDCASVAHPTSMSQNIGLVRDCLGRVVK